MTVQSKVTATEAVGSFTIIPVLDLKDGLVVHARAGKHAHAGKRAEYRPLATPFGSPHDAVAIARALLGITFSPVLYIADLDAISGRGNNFDLCRELSDAFPGTTLWIDPGSDTYVIVLANVIHQRGGPPIVGLSGDVATAAARALHLYGS